MTHNQINYWNLKESERHNSEQETISKESNRIANINAQASMLGAQARMIDAETNRYLAPSKEFANYSQAPANAAIGGVITGIKILGENGEDLTKYTTDSKFGMPIVLG